jgi:hypothetical protein
VRVNNRIARGMPRSLPRDGQAPEHRRDPCHWFRTGNLVVTFAAFFLRRRPLRPDRAIAVHGVGQIGLRRIDAERRTDAR